MHESSEPREALRIRPREFPREHTTKIETDEIFRALIAEELRNGRLNPAQRRRIVRYAARMGLSAVEAGKLLSACREEALASADADLREFALRLAPAEARRSLPLPIRVAIALLVAWLIHWLVGALS